MAKSTPPPTTAPAAREANASANLPVHTVRHRNIKATIWKNQTDRGPMYNVTVSRSYREGENWRDSHSFGYDDLMNLAKVLYDAHSHITALRAKDQPTTRGKRSERAPSQ